MTMALFSDADLSAGAMQYLHVRERRREALLKAEHMRPLIDFVRNLAQQRPKAFVPQFDPAGGGVHSRILFLLEKPGPKTDPKRRGSGFISVCNNDPTAKAMHKFMEQRGLPINYCLHWNVIPWWDGAIEYDADQLRDGRGALQNLINDLLPELKAVVLVGRAAQRNWDRCPIQNSRLRTYRSAHPANRVRNAFPEIWAAIPSCWPTLAAIEALE